MFRWMAALATVAMLALAAAACGEDDETTGLQTASKPDPSRRSMRCRARRPRSSSTPALSKRSARSS